MSDAIAYFITWTIYGTHLPGSEKWWNKKGYGLLPPRPRLEQWCRDRLKFPIQTLQSFERRCLQKTIEKHCEVRNWRLWAVNPRTTHVHVVVTARLVLPETTRDQFKAYCTRCLRNESDRWTGRDIWTPGGYCSLLDDEEDLANAIEYVVNGQDYDGC